MQAFWNGFEKSAGKKKKPASSAAGDIGRGGAVALGGYLASAPAGLLSNITEKYEGAAGPKQIDKFVSQVRKARGLNTSLHIGDHAPHYNMLEDAVKVPANSSLGTVAHEFGHAATMGKQWRSKGLTKALPVARGIGQGFSLGAPAMMLISGNEKLENAAPYAAAGLMLPSLVEEGAASVKGLRDIKRFSGNAAFRRALPNLAAAYGTYLARPIGAGLLAKYLVSKKRQAQEADK